MKRAIKLGSLVLLGTLVFTAVAHAAHHGNHEDRTQKLLNNEQALERIAEVLGMDADSLIAELEAGITLRELAQEQGLTREDFPRFRGHKGALLNQLTEASGLTAEEIRDMIHSGESTIQELAAEYGIELKH